jgi:ATP-dependent protease ClpP protease subunit
MTLNATTHPHVTDSSIQPLQPVDPAHADALSNPIAPAGQVEFLAAERFRNPAVRLSGTVDYFMYENFRAQLINAQPEGLIVVELSTLGGDPEVARMMGEDIRYHTEVDPQRRFVFLGKAAIYSAGTTFMSFFARENRYLTRGTRLMIHERKLTKTLEISGPLTTCIAGVKATLHEIESSIEIQNEGFANLIVGSKVTMDEVLEKAPSNWYLEAQEAQSLGLIEGIL